eukprot:gb/GECG01008111.1/.p1 GENE.gb/GECG01008111.1/~~gb/GECG01008111.1/.p1  ORF type:complete len:172 (+),score=14.22 gb/GECG01008111.1/:1-516(+)
MTTTRFMPYIYIKKKIKKIRQQLRITCVMANFRKSCLGVVFLLLVVAAAGASKMPVTEELLNAMIQVESGGDENAIGDNGKAIGPLQIWEVYWRDAVEHSGIGGSYEDCKGPGSTAYSKRIVRAYMARYATESRLGRPPTAEDIARIHNGGPNGHTHSATAGYWEKVKARM